MTKLTKSQKTILRYYLGLNRAQFRLSHEAIAEAIWGVEQRKHKTRTVRRANDRLLEDGILTWERGYGSKGTYCQPNTYTLNPDAIWAHKRNQRRQKRAQMAATAPVAVAVISSSDQWSEFSVQ